MKFRKKPIEVEAIKWKGTNLIPISIFIEDERLFKYHHFRNNGSGELIIYTLEGPMVASTGDWIIKEPFATEDRKFYPCKPGIFSMTYEKVDS